MIDYHNYHHYHQNNNLLLLHLHHPRNYVQNQLHFLLSQYDVKLLLYEVEMIKNQEVIEMLLHKVLMELFQLVEEKELLEYEENYNHPKIFKTNN